MRRLLMVFAIVGALSGCTQQSDRAEQVAIDTTTSKVPIEPMRPGGKGLSLRYSPPPMVLYCVAQQEDTLDTDSVHLRVRTELFFTERIERVTPAGIIQMRFRYDSIRLVQRYWETDSTRPSIVRYSSTDSTTQRDPQFEMLAAAIGEEIQVMVSSKGTIEEISGVAGIVRRLLGRTVDSLDVQQRQIVDEQIKRELFGNVVVQQFLVLPSEPLDSTLRWSRTVEQEFPPLFTARATATYVLHGVERRAGDSLLHIRASLDGAIGLQPQAKRAGVVIRQGKVRGTASGIFSQRYGLMLRRQNMIEYDLVAEARQSANSIHRVRQRKKTVYTFAVTAAAMLSADR
ncbi:MAG: DUF6263 family protein [Bacteroidota bacterium]|nr:DUF6263 family protein [Candidatus Kapabacteria bacterium]MDW8271776.1 DUF6263 family protein [Bacteroidota bacterium]